MKEANEMRGMGGMRGRGFRGHRSYRGYGRRPIYRPMRPWIWRGWGWWGMGWLFLPALGIGTILLLVLLPLIVR
jgi:hypothetical protein